MRFVSRRSVLAMTGVAGVSTFSGCLPVATVANPATVGFLQQLGVAIAATASVDLAAEFAAEPASTLATTLRELIPAWVERDEWSYGSEGFRTEQGDVVLVRYSRLTAEEWDAGEGQSWRDHEVGMLLVSADSVTGVRLPTWAWQGLIMFTDWFVNERPADLKPEARALARFVLAPGSTRSESSESPTGLVAWTGYQSATGGYVDLAKLEREDRSFSVWIKVSGLPASDGGPVVKEFELPTSMADDQLDCKVWI